MKQYLTSQGLQTLWNQIKALFATKAELNQKANKTELNTLSESVSASLSEIEQTDIRQDASISSLSENKADKTTLNKLSTDTTTALDKKVDKVSGMGLSHNDYTDEDKAKLDGIEEHANNYSLPIAGSELGGVKNGGDITIQPDGTMQVNDDSHNHIINNVDGLQSALDGKRNEYKGRINISTDIDWENITESGAYFIIPEAQGVINAINGPEGVNHYGILIVETLDDNLLQIYYPIVQGYNNIVLARRLKYGTSWSDWNYIYEKKYIVETYATKTENNNKVDKVSGKGLSTNDYTTAEKNKLDGVAAGAEVNTIVAVQRNGTAITPKDRVVNILVPVKTSELNNDSTYQTAADVAETIVGVKLDLASGIITLTRKNGTTFTLDLPTEKIIKSGRYDSETEEIVLVLEDESEIRFSASELIDEYYADESTLELYTDTADGNKKKFRIKTAYKNKIDGSEQTTNKTASVSSSSTETQYPTAKAVYNAVKDLATKVQTFTQASTRANIESGETISTVFGKIRKWFDELYFHPLRIFAAGQVVEFKDTTEMLSSHPDGTEASGDYAIASTPLIKLWAYIQAKIKDVLGLTASNYNGTAAKATADGSGNNISSTYATKAELSRKISKTVGWCTNNSTTPYWFLIAGYTCTTELFDLNTTFIASRNFNSQQAIITAKIRQGQMGNVEICDLVAIAQEQDFPISDLAIAYKGTAGSKAEFQIWAKCPIQYQSMSIMPIYFGTRTIHSNSDEYWTLIQTNENYPELRANVRADDGLFDHPTGFTLKRCKGPEYRKLSGCLELTDSNLATYFANGTLTIPNGVTTVIFNTTAVKTVYLVKGTVQTNGYRLTIGGKWQPDTNSDYQGLDGCFPYYVDYHYLGHTGSFLPNIDAYSHFADYVYFNGMWFSKMY